MSLSDELGRLADLYQRGALTDEEFRRAKARLLDAAALPAPAGSAREAVNGLRRSRDDRWLGGVCGGIGRAFGLAGWTVRVVFLLLLLYAGVGFWLYLLMWLLVPSDPVMPVNALR